MEEFEYYLKIPKDRIGVIIGEKGEKKRELESLLGVALQIDSEEGDVVLKGTDNIKLFTGHEIIKAIARGFNPDIAKLLLKTDYMLEIINITEYATTKNQMIRLKGRVIGEQGKSRRAVEELAEAYIVVYGKTISLIGQADNVYAAKRAVDMLLSGAPHATVFRLLERLKRDRTRKEFEQPSQSLE